VVKSHLGFEELALFEKGLGQLFDPFTEVLELWVVGLIVGGGWLWFEEVLYDVLALL
jgi:hypothetical protein